MKIGPTFTMLIAVLTVGMPAPTVCGGRDSRLIRCDGGNSQLLSSGRHPTSRYD